MGARARYSGKRFILAASDLFQWSPQSFEILAQTEKNKMAFSLYFLIWRIRFESIIEKPYQGFRERMVPDNENFAPFCNWRKRGLNVRCRHRRRGFLLL